MLEGEEEQDRGALEEGDGHRVVEEGGVQAEEQRHEQKHAAVSEQGHRGGLLHVGDTVLHEPVEDLEEEQRREERDETHLRR